MLGCSHRCRCFCHGNDSVKHVVACCTICPWCNTKVTLSKIHQKMCHEEEEILERIISEAAGLLVDPEAWIDVPIKRFDEKTSRELVQEGRGDEALAHIEFLKDGGMEQP